MSDDLISRRALYERAATLEAQALDYVGKLIERDGEETSIEWRIWSAILTERTAFKHDVYDAPSAQPERCEDCENFSKTRLLIPQKALATAILKDLPSAQPERRGKWVKDGETYALYKCSACNEICSGAGWANCIKKEQMYKTFKFCPHCGARMEEQE